MEERYLYKYDLQIVLQQFHVKIMPQSLIYSNPQTLARSKSPADWCSRTVPLLGRASSESKISCFRENSESDDFLGYEARKQIYGTESEDINAFQQHPRNIHLFYGDGDRPR